jgi:cellulase/cellobiase CelA1
LSHGWDETFGGGGAKMRSRINKIIPTNSFGAIVEKYTSASSQDGKRMGFHGAKRGFKQHLCRSLPVGNVVKMLLYPPTSLIFLSVPPTN